MLVQCVVDSDMHFMDVFVGFSGSINDTKLLHNSAFYYCATRGLILNGPKYGNGSFSIMECIVADGGYPLLPWLMRPYKMPATPTEKLFNHKLSSTRIVAKRALGWLKLKWRYLHGKVMKPYPRHLARAIIAYCLLHNIGLDCEETIDDYATCDGNIDGIMSDKPTSNVEAMQDSLAKFLQPL
ncbi:hypothetical protein L7F22_050891 [Adiantum nelumboides]|nr:hypothetical protein [Adiantum nelumboides]